MGQQAGFDVLFAHCAGLDVHKATIQACVLLLEPSGEVTCHERQFTTVTRDILALGEWLAGHGVTQVAMEATGVYWKPIWNLLETRFDLWLCNAHHVKQVPGRTTDVTSARWLAKLMQCGLLKRSFVACRALRELRDLARQRVKLVEEHTAIGNRIQAVLEDANIKLACVATDALGVSGRQIIRALINGEQDAAVLAELAKGRLRKKIPELQEALFGRVDEHHRFLLDLNMGLLDGLEQAIERLEARSSALLEGAALNAGTGTEASQPLPFTLAVELLDTHPGIDQCGARTLLAEIGTDMSRFPTDAALVSWAGICPGTNESAGKRRSTKTPQGNRWLRRILTQLAWVAIKQKDCYLGSLFRRIAARRGKKRAIIAVARAMLISIYHMLKDHEAYRELGADYLAKANPEATKRRLCARLRNLGYDVTLTPKETVA